MKNIHYLSVQGRCAPTFWFKDHDAQYFRGLLEAITEKKALVISSVYRTDIFYSSTEDLTETVLRAWTALKNFPYDTHTKDRFIRASNSKKVYELFFDTLLYIIPYKHHFKKYKDQMSELYELEPQHPILKDLMQCDYYMSEIYNEQHIQYESLSPELLKAQLPSCENLANLAHRSIQHINYN